MLFVNTIVDSIGPLKSENCCNDTGIHRRRGHGCAGAKAGAAARLAFHAGTAAQAGALLRASVQSHRQSQISVQYLATI